MEKIKLKESRLVECLVQIQFFYNIAENEKNLTKMLEKIEKHN